MSRRYGDETDLSTGQVLRRDIPWETYMTARLISDRDLQLIRRYDKRSSVIKASLLDEEGPAYVETFLTVLRNVTKEETVQYVLAVLDDLVTVAPSRAAFFHKQSPMAPDPYTIFLKLLQRTDWFTQEKACGLLTAILEARPDKELPHVNGAGHAAANGTADPAQAGSSSGGIVSAAAEGVEGTLVSFVDWLGSQLRRPSQGARSVVAAVGALGKLLKEPTVRLLFTRAGGVQLLAPLLRSAGAGAAPSQQLSYDTGLAIWQLTFYHPAAQLMGSTGIVGGLVEMVRAGQKEKVVRIALLALRNLLQQADLEAAPEMVERGLPKLVVTRSYQNWEDEDVPALLEALNDELQKNIQELSSFEKYKKEVLSGSLDWTPMHTSDAFWRENGAKFEEKDFQILRVLLKLLEASREPRTLAVGAHDLGQLVTYLPSGKGTITELKGKELMLPLVQHPDAEVRKNALLALQKILLSKDKQDFMTGLS